MLPPLTLSRAQGAVSFFWQKTPSPEYSGEGFRPAILPWYSECSQPPSEPDLLRE